MKGLEPSRVAPLPPQGSVSTNSTTSARAIEPRNRLAIFYQWLSIAYLFGCFVGASAGVVAAAGFSVFAAGGTGAVGDIEPGAGICVLTGAVSITLPELTGLPPK